MPPFKRETAALSKPHLAHNQDDDGSTPSPAMRGYSPVARPRPIPETGGFDSLIHDKPVQLDGRVLASQARGRGSIPLMGKARLGQW